MIGSYRGNGLASVPTPSPCQLLQRLPSRRSLGEGHPAAGDRQDRKGLDRIVRDTGAGVTARSRRSVHGEGVCSRSPLAANHPTVFLAKWSGLGSIENIACVSVVGIVQSSSRGTGGRANEESDASTVVVAYVGPPGPLRSACFTGTRVDSEG